MLCTSTTLLVFTKIAFGPCSGTIPTEIGQLPKLDELALGDNKLTGEGARHTNFFLKMIME